MLLTPCRLLFFISNDCRVKVCGHTRVIYCQWMENPLFIISLLHYKIQKQSRRRINTLEVEVKALGVSYHNGTEMKIKNRKGN